MKLSYLDYIIIGYILYQMFVGYRKGLEKIVYDIVKYIAIFGGLFACNKYALPVLEKSKTFIEHSDKINETSRVFMLNFKPDEQIPALAYQKIIDTIPYDKILLSIIIIIIALILTRLIIYGSIVEEESEHKKLGMLFSLLKSGFIVYIFLKIIDTLLLDFFMEYIEMGLIYTYLKTFNIL